MILLEKRPNKSKAIAKRNNLADLASDSRIINSIHSNEKTKKVAME
jgi:hypothetical protein